MAGLRILEDLVRSDGGLNALPDRMAGSSDDVAVMAVAIGSLFEVED